MSTSRPNILFIMSDEHDPAVTGCYGDPIVQTPHLDRLAASGIAFDACYCNSPLCVPSRLSFTTGQYISHIDIWSLQHRLPSDEHPSIAHALNAAGYRSLLCGKQHFDRRHRYGFTDLLPDAGTNNCLVSGQVPRRAPDDTTINTNAWLHRSNGFHVGDNSFVLTHDRKVTERAKRFLRDETGPGQQPFFLFVGYLAPHFPLIVPEEYARRYAGRVGPPRVNAAALAAMPRNYQHLRRGFGNEGADPALEQKGRDLYWAFVDWFDGQVGQLLGALGDSSVADNTIVIYTSDHGENKGDHGLWWKNAMYESSARVPLLISWPARWAGGQRRATVCSLVDVAQTVLNLAGTKAPDDWDGQSLLGCLDNSSDPGPDFAISEYYAHNVATGYVMFRRGHWKYVYHTAADKTHGPERELYDMTADPHEEHNLAGDPAQAGRIAKMHADMLLELGEDPEETERRCREQMAVGYGDVPVG